MHAIPFFIVFLMPISAVVGLTLGGLWPLLTPILVFGAIPILDRFSGHDAHNPDAEQVAARDHNPLYRAALYLWVPAQLGVLGWGLLQARAGLSLGEGLALALCLGVISGGGGINVAHELMHHRSRLDRALAEILMYAVAYPWFCVEHVLGHHRRVATPADPATAALGTSLYAFLPRVLVGSVVSAWRLEADRCRRRGIAPHSLADRRLRYGIVLGVMVAALAAAGPAALALFGAQAIVAILLLETINYVEHYGLVREVGADGRPVRVAPVHSWNSTHRLTSWFLFQLPRHADHHAKASRPYWQLRTHDDAPMLPYGYPTMLMMAWVPPLWARTMDGRVATATARATRKLHA